MTQRDRPFRILPLVALSLLVLAPVQAEATSHFLTQLCTKLPTCGPVLATILPKIAKADSPITPGGYVVIQGSGFGQTEGELSLTGLWTHPVGDELATVKWVKLIIPKGPGWDFWTPTQVLGQVPDNITRVRDQQVKLQIKTKDNKWSNEYPVKFVARRDMDVIPSSDPAVQVPVGGCSDDANWNSCGTGPCLFPATLCGSHENCWGCIGDDSGTDTFNITLKNDWVFTSNSIHVEVSAGGKGSASALPGLPIGPNVWQQSVSWSVTPADWVEYFVGVSITGPIGVPWK